MPSQRPITQMLRRLRRGADGAAAVEFALVVPVLAGLLVPMIDFGRGAYEKMRVESAAEAGAQYALANPSSYDASAITSAAQDATNLAGIAVTPSETCNCITDNALGPAVSCSSTCADGSTPGTFVSVQTQSNYSPLLAYPGVPSAMTLGGFSIVRIQ